MSHLVIPRSSWKAKPPLWEKVTDLPITYVFTIFTNQRSCYGLDACSEELQALQEEHMHNLLVPTADIKYNFMVAPDGAIYEGRGWSLRPTLPKINGRLNRSSIYIGMLGTFSFRNRPPFEMFESHRNIIEYGLKNYLIDKKHIHIFYNLLKDTFQSYIDYQKVTSEFELVKVEKTQPIQQRICSFDDVN